MRVLVAMGGIVRVDKAALLEALRLCGNAVVASGTALHPWSPTYQLGGPAAIDDLVGELTGDRRFFRAKSSSAP